MVCATYDVASIKNAQVRKATDAMVKAVKAGVKSGWQFAFHAAVVKEAFNAKTMSDDLKAQFKSIKEYCDAVGISTASIHNSAKALTFMAENNLVPKCIDKKGKEHVDFDRFSLNVAQAVELAALTPEQFANLKLICEQEKVTISGLSSSTIRKFKTSGTIISEGRHNKAIEDKTDTKTDSKTGSKTDTKTDSKTGSKADTKTDNKTESKNADAGTLLQIGEHDIKAVDPSTVSKEQVINIMLDMMETWKVEMTEFAAAYNARLTEKK